MCPMGSASLCLAMPPPLFVCTVCFLFLRFSSLLLILVHCHFIIMTSIPLQIYGKKMKQPRNRLDFLWRLH